ncbi:MAG TPA: inosine/xanthosine triphosphatase [Patescibacteria group bacterium]
MKIALGSTSDSKISILKDALKSLVESEIDIVGFEVESGITDQPLNEEVTIQGASNRAKNALTKAKNKDFSVGLEGGLQEIADKGYFLVCVAAIYDFDGHLSIGIGGKLQLPKEVSERIKKGEQFGEVIREYESKHKGDKNVMPLVQALISRKTAFEEAIQNAYLSYLNKKHFI